MRLRKIRIRDFRCISDSGDFSLDQVTCLVGKNESGKTAILKAIQKLNPDDKSLEAFVPSSDYPRRKWIPNVPVPADPPAIATLWELEQSDIDTLETKFGKGVIKDRQFNLSKGYGAQPKYEVLVDHAALISDLVPQPQFSSEDLQPIAGHGSIDDIIGSLKALSPRSAAQENLLSSLTAKFPDGVETTVSNSIAALLPTFLYFDEYLTLPGTVSVDQITTRQRQGQLTDKDRIFLALLSLAGTTLESINQTGTYEEFNASLRAVSNQITDMIFRYWSQNRYLDVDLKLDSARPADQAPFNSGMIFRTRIENRRHRADTSFDERSRGFVWFFSFLIWFYQLRKLHGDNLVILLDEPGLSLHARAQGDLLRYINEQLRPQYQVVYTTHSPFMIDTDNLLSARTVEDVVRKDTTSGEEILLGTQVGEDVLSTDADTISPLQRALDYEITQTLFVGKHTLLVEGPSDLVYLKWFSRQLQEAGKEGLDYRWNICICRGLSKIPPFASLFRGNKLNIAAIVDVHKGEKQQIVNAKAALPDGHLLTLDNYSSQTEADIEDVLGREFYVAVVNKALDLRPQDELPATKTANAPKRVIEEVEQLAATLPPHYMEFGHYAPAEWLMRNGDEGKNLTGFSDALQRFEVLIGAINKLL